MELDQEDIDFLKEISKELMRINSKVYKEESLELDNIIDRAQQKEWDV